MTKFAGNSALSTFAALIGLSYVMTMGGCAPAPPPDTRAADEAAIRKTDAEWVKAAQTKQVDAWMAFYSDDVVVLPPNDKIATSKDAVRKVLAEMLALPGLAITWQQTKVEVAQSGDIAYAYGTYSLTMNDPKGKPMTDTGKILEVWKKQAGGGWKCSVDTWNSDLPATPPPPSK